MDEEEKEQGEETGLFSSLSLRALSVECSGSDRAVRVRWLLSLIRPAHSRSSNQARCSATSKVELQSGACRAPQQVLRAVYVQREEGSSAVYSHRLLQSGSSSCSLPARQNKHGQVDFNRIINKLKLCLLLEMTFDNR